MCAGWILPLKCNCPNCRCRLYIQGSTDGSLENVIFCPKCGKKWKPEEFEKLLNKGEIKC